MTDRNEQHFTVNDTFREDKRHRTSNTGLV